MLRAAPVCCLLLLKLAVIKLRIEAVLRQKLLVLALLDDVPVLHNENHVRLADGRERCATMKLVRPVIICENAC